jgi:uncharacterized membrane protein
MRRSNGPVTATLRALSGLLIAFPVALFSFAVATDIAYLRTAELQWTNFSAWSISVGLVFGAVALVCALLGFLAHIRADRRGLRGVLVGALGVMCGLGLINAFKHSQDAWSSVGAFGLTLSILTAIAALVAGAIVYSGALDGEAAE